MATSRSAPTARKCLAVGLLFGIAGTCWILTGWRRIAFGIYYHVPLAVVFGCWAASLVWSARGRVRWLDTAAGALAVALVSARIALDWPLSGHGILAGLIAVRAPWPWLRLAALAILLQTLTTKWWLGQEPLTALWGALAGATLGALATALSRSRRRTG